MKRRYNGRLACAEVLRRDLGLQRLLDANTGLAERALSSAEADEHEFAAILGEPMPEHLRAPAHRDAAAWLAVHTTLVAAKNAQVADEEYKRLVPRAERQTLAKLLQEEILYSPLRNRFLDALVALRQVPR
jgi:hypothetical protein